MSTQSDPFTRRLRDTGFITGPNDKIGDKLRALVRSPPGRYADTRSKVAEEENQIIKRVGVNIRWYEELASRGVDSTTAYSSRGDNCEFIKQAVDGMQAQFYDTTGLHLSYHRYFFSGGCEVNVAWGKN